MSGIVLVSDGTPTEALELLGGGQVTHLDLGWNLGQGRDRTGISILKWLETAVRLRQVPMPEISVNTSATGHRARCSSSHVGSTIPQPSSPPFLFYPAMQLVAGEHVTAFLDEALRAFNQGRHA